MTPDLCVAVTASDESAALLHQAVETRLFIRALRGSTASYEFHHLFRDLLLHELAQRTPRHHRDLLHRRAAEWYLHHNDLTTAIPHLVAAGEHDRAADLIHAAARPALLRNDLRSLPAWLRSLPETCLNRRPELLIELAWISMQTGGDNLHTILKRIQDNSASTTALSPSAQEDRDTLAILARIVSSDQNGLYNDVTALIKRLSPGNHLARGWAHLVAALAVGSINPETPSLPHIQHALAAFRAITYSGGQITALLVRSAIEQVEGKATAAIATCQNGLAIAQTLPNPDLSDLYALHFLAGETLYWLNRPNDAITHFKEALAITELLDNPSHIVYARCWLQLCAAALGQQVEITAEEIADEDRLVARALRTQARSNIAQMIDGQVRRWLILGHPTRAWQAWQQIGTDLESLTIASPYVFWYSTFSAWIARGQELERLTPYFRKFIERERKAHRNLPLIRAQILACRQEQLLGNHNAARARMRPLLHMVETTGLHRTILEFPSFAPLLRATPTPFAQRLLSELSETAPAIIAGTNATLTTRERQILTLLSEGRSNAQIAQHLALTEGTIKNTLTRIYQRLGVNNRNQALAIAHARGIL